MNFFILFLSGLFIGGCVAVEIALSLGSCFRMCTAIVKCLATHTHIHQSLCSFVAEVCQFLQVCQWSLDTSLTWEIGYDVRDCISASRLLTAIWFILMSVACDSKDNDQHYLRWGNSGKHRSHYWLWSRTYRKLVHFWLWKKQLLHALFHFATVLQFLDILSCHISCCVTIKPDELCLKPLLLFRFVIPPLIHCSVFRGSNDSAKVMALTEHWGLNKSWNDFPKSWPRSCFPLKAVCFGSDQLISLQTLWGSIPWWLPGSPALPGSTDCSVQRPVWGDECGIELLSLIQSNMMRLKERQRVLEVITSSCRSSPLNITARVFFLKLELGLLCFVAKFKSYAFCLAVWELSRLG